EQIPADIRKVGQATGYEQRANRLADAFLRRIETINELTSKVQDRPGLYWEWWPNPIYTPGGANWLSDVSDLAGARNVFSDYDVANVKATREMVSERAPEHICVVWCGIELKRIKPAMVTDRPEWQYVPAIQKNQVHLLDEGLYCRPSP